MSRAATELRAARARRDPEFEAIISGRWTREQATAFIADLAWDMQMAETSHVRRQGRRLAKALEVLS